MVVDLPTGTQDTGTGGGYRSVRGDADNNATDGEEGRRDNIMGTERGTETAGVAEGGQEEADRAAGYTDGKRRERKPEERSGRWKRHLGGSCCGR